MHDVGKLVVPNHLLNKPGKLTAEEFAIVRMHEDVSVEILTTIDFLAPVAPSATSEAARSRRSPTTTASRSSRTSSWSPTRTTR